MDALDQQLSEHDQSGKKASMDALDTQLSEHSQTEKQLAMDALDQQLSEHSSFDAQLAMNDLEERLLDLAGPNGTAAADTAVGAAQSRMNFLEGVQHSGDSNISIDITEEYDVDSGAVTARHYVTGLQDDIGLPANGSFAIGDTRLDGTSIACNTATMAVCEINSDRRLKENIEDIDTEKALVDVSKLQPKEYNLIKNPGTKRWGFIAQSIQGTPMEHIVVGKETEDTYLGVNYLDLTALIPTLCKKILALEKTISEMTP